MVVIGLTIGLIVGGIKYRNSRKRQGTPHNVVTSIESNPTGRPAATSTQLPSSENEEYENESAGSLDRMRDQIETEQPTKRSDLSLDSKQPALPPLREAERKGPYTHLHESKDHSSASTSHSNQTYMDMDIEDDLLVGPVGKATNDSNAQEEYEVSSKKSNHIDCTDNDDDNSLTGTVLQTKEHEMLPSNSMDKSNPEQLQTYC